MPTKHYTVAGISGISRLVNAVWKELVTKVPSSFTRRCLSDSSPPHSSMLALSLFESQRKWRCHVVNAVYETTPWSIPSAAVRIVMPCLKKESAHHRIASAIQHSTSMGTYIAGRVVKRAYVRGDIWA